MIIFINHNLDNKNMNKKLFILPVLLSLLLLVSPGKAQIVNEVNTTILGIRRTDEGIAEGILADLEVELRQNGEGRVFISSMPLTKVDTQASARLAKETACNILNKNCSKHDFVYIVRSDSPMVGGPSAGASMTVATLALLTNKSLNQSVMITGTINPDGSIGPVGGLMEKARAAYNGGGRFLLIPDGQKIIQTTKTERERTGPIITEEIQTEEINLQEYALKNWGMNVKEISDIKGAYKYYTGYKIKTPRIEGEVESKVFENIIKKMFGSIYNRTKGEFERLKDKEKKSALSLSMDKRMKRVIEKIKEGIEKLKTYKKQGKYYSGASTALQANIKIRYGLNLIEYSKANSKKIFTDQKIEEISDDVSSLEKQLKNNRTVSSRSEIEVLTTAIDRLKEAEDLLDSANEQYYGSNYEEAIYQASFAKERMETAKEWLSIKDELRGDLNINFHVSKFETLAQARISEAQSKIAYVRTLGIKPGSASKHLKEAQEAYKTGNYVYVIFESLKSISIANLRMEIRGVKEESLHQRIQEKKEQVKKRIKEVRNRGVLPILSISYLEYSEDKEDPLTSLVYLEYAKQFSSLSNNLLSTLRSSKALEKEEATVRDWERPKGVEKWGAKTLIKMGMFLLVGLSIGFISGMVIDREIEK